MALEGIEYYADDDPMQRSTFRTTWTQPEGLNSAYLIESVVVDVNLKRWTVDCLSKFDQRRYLNIQVASPYLHPNSGEGIYVVPDVGAKCYVAIPSDGPPPFVAFFIMPMQRVDVVAEVQSNPDVQTDTHMNFAGGRERQKMGDIHIRGRDGNFCILHRGGVLQIGSTQLAQRIYIPVGNIVEDVSQNYRHYNTGGARIWGVKAGPSETNPPTFLKQTLRLFANEEKATVRISMGTFSDIVVEPRNGQTSNLEQLGIGTDDPLVCEVVLAPEGFNADSGTPEKNAPDLSKFRFFFDKAGGTFLRAEGSILIASRKKIRLVADDDIDVFCKNFNMNLEGSLKITAGGGPAEITGDVLVLNAGTKPVAHVGSLVNIVLPAPIPILIGTTPGTITAGAVFQGQIISGNPTILV